MEAILIINDVDFTPYLCSGGLQQKEVVRQGRGMVDLSGTAHRVEIVKRGISVGLVEVRDKTWYRLVGALQTRPATVRYIDDRLGEVVKRFYVTSPAASAKTVRGGHTYFSGGSFELEEK